MHEPTHTTATTTDHDLKTKREHCRVGCANADVALGLYALSFIMRDLCNRYANVHPSFADQLKAD